MIPKPLDFIFNVINEEHNVVSGTLKHYYNEF